MGMSSEDAYTEAAYERLIAGNLPDTEVARERNMLLEDCKRDTEAMVRAYQKLTAQDNGL